MTRWTPSASTVSPASSSSTSAAATAEAAPTVELTDTAARVLELLADAPLGHDELVRASGLAASAVAAALVELELAGLAAEADGVHRVTRIPERAA